MTTVVYGVDWDGSASNALTRLESGVGKTPGSDFDTAAPWSGMRRVNLLDDGTVSAVYGNRCYTDVNVTGMGQCMVQIPKFWYAVDTTDIGHGGHTRYYIANGDASGTINNAYGAGTLTFAVHPAFLRHTTTEPYLYLGAFEGYINPVTFFMESKAGVRPTTTNGDMVTVQSLSALRVAGRGHGAEEYTQIGWGIQDYRATTAVQLLYLVEYASFESQTVPPGGLGHGIVDVATDGTNNCASFTGHTGTYGTDLGNASGQVTHDNEYWLAKIPPVTYTTHANSYRGIENFFGNTITIIDGLKLVSNGVYIAGYAFDDVYSPMPAVYWSSGVVWSSTTGNITSFDTSTNGKWAFIPSACSGTNYGIYAHDQNVCGTGATIVPCYGGDWTSAYAAGMFCWMNWLSIANTNYRSIGSRLMFMGSIGDV